MLSRDTIGLLVTEFAQMTTETSEIKTSQALQSPAIILVDPQLGENIGMAARAMANFSLTDLRLVSPREAWPNKDAYSAAAGASRVIDDARVYEDVCAAIADLHYVCATTARSRDSVKQVLAPQSAALEMRTRIRVGQNCGVMFGCEKAGLENDHLALADILVMAPVNPRFASLNLAQAVLIMGYEWLKQEESGMLGRVTAFDGPACEGVQMLHTRPATHGEMAGLFEHLERELDASGFLRPPEKRPQMVRNLRNMFQRMGASEQEVRTLRGVISSMTRAHKRRD